MPSTHFRIRVGTEIPKNPTKFSIIVPWSYRSQIQHTERYKNLVIFHSSDLPRGRGWAPLANLFLKNIPEYTLTGFLPNSKIDDGDIIIKITFPMETIYTATILRKWDAQLTIIATRILLDKLKNDEFIGIKQEITRATYFEKRIPEMGELNLNSSIVEQINLLRSAEHDHPSYIVYEGEKFKIVIDPFEPPKFPENIKVNFPKSAEEFDLREIGIEI